MSTGLDPLAIDPLSETEAEFMRELDELPWEARRSTATSFRLWPKVDGVNVAAEAGPTFTVHDPSGTEIYSGTATVEDRGTYSSIRCDIPGVNLGTLGEDYTLRCEWTPLGDTVAQLYVRTFDVVRFPFGQPHTSLNDMLEERPDCGRLLDRLGPLLSSTEGDREYAAGVMAVRARVELEAMVRSAVRDARGSASGDAAGSATQSVAAASALGAGYTRPNLILNRERLGRVERLLAMAALYESVADDPTGENSDKSGSALAQFFRGKAMTAWANVGPLKFDTSDEQLRVAQTVTNDQRRVTYTRREQS